MTVFRRASLAEVHLMLDWAADEGWNPGQADAEAFVAADPAGFFVADDNGVPVAAISVVTHAPDVAFLGLYLCRPAFRGKGIGYGLWQHALRQTSARSIGLDGVPAQVANYAKSGFARIGRSRRLQGTLLKAPRTLPDATAEDAEALVALDTAANGYPRPAFLRAWTAQQPSRHTVVLREGGRITGFATARLCREGCKIGPIIAPTAQDALTLATEAAAALRQTTVTIDVPESGLARLLEARGFAETFCTARMFRGPAPAPDATLQAIATMELG